MSRRKLRTFVSSYIQEALRRALILLRMNARGMKETSLCIFYRPVRGLKSKRVSFPIKFGLIDAKMEKGRTRRHYSSLIVSCAR